MSRVAPKRKPLSTDGGPYEVRIIDQDLDMAVPQDPSRCAIAVAVKRSYPQARYVNVGRDTIKFSFVDEKGVRQRVTARTSIRAMEAQRRLDSGEYVDPEDFGTIRFFMDEVKVAPSAFTEETRIKQNAYREEIRAGVRQPEKMSESEKAKRRLGRRHA